MYNAHPSNCGKYIICAGPVGVHILKCPEELHWDTKKKICNWKRFAGCGKLKIIIYKNPKTQTNHIFYYFFANLITLTVFIECYLIKHLTLFYVSLKAKRPRKKFLR